MSILTLHLLTFDIVMSQTVKTVTPSPLERYGCLTVSYRVLFQKVSGQMYVAKTF